MEFRFPLKQHVGAPCISIVKEAEEIQRGQKIAEPNGLGAYIHSSVNGVVKTVNDYEIIIEGDENQPKDYLPIKETNNKLEAIREAGIIGAGGAGFPTHIKLKTKIPGGYAIVNAAECEPILGHNIHYLEKNAKKVINGLKYIMEITEAQHGIIAIKPKHKNAIDKLKEAIGKDPIDIKFLKDLYPAGDERVIIREILGIELKPGQLPSEANAVVQNVETVKNIALAIEDRKPVIDKDVTVGGRVKNAPKGMVIMDVPVGYPVIRLIETAGGYVNPHGEIVLGGPFTGKSGKEDTPVTKTLGGVLVAMPFPQDKRKFGILACECGAQEGRLREIVEAMGGKVVAEEKCKRMVEVGGRYRCELPGICPGQAQTVMKLKKKGAEVIFTGSCGD
ncbi:proline reductase-associated electron transfer protein PrdC [Garciella nitratireducens DSM 15102]|uniref:Proline reductase-associated electron transfer protein PrdC n=2 Tax=Garciella TaxID=218204 RepID=A0A1T4LKW4_9FIRM|nr:proline reductase-associated electron transfer protein PrdC [Garciella nitratireducens DSM 15102]